MSAFAEFFAQAEVMGAFVANTWWFWLPVVLFFVGREVWRAYLKVRYFTFLEWVVLEVRIPRDISKSPQAMEQIFAGLQTMYWEFDPLEKWWQGLQHDYIIFEMVSHGGDTRFYIRTPIFFRNVVEAHVYAQYPESEIVEVSDYMASLPEVVPNEEWDIFGLEFSLDKPDAYPIRTYVEFSTTESMKEEERKVDPFSSMAELFGKLRPGEHMGYHLLIRPAQTGGADKWRKEGEALVNKLIGKKVKPPKGKIGRALEPLEPISKGWGEPLKPLFGLSPADALPPKKEESGESTLMQHLSPGTKDIVAAIERNILKPGFETIVRFSYVARRDMFTTAHLSSFIGALKTYNTQTMNAFKINGESMSGSVTWWWPKYFKKRRQADKKRTFYNYYRARKPFTDTLYLKSKMIVLNTEELATIYHFPGTTAKAPMMPRIEARRSEPPAMLPVG